MILLLSGARSCSVIESFFDLLIWRPLFRNIVFSMYWSGPALVHNLVFTGLLDSMEGQKNTPISVPKSKIVTGFEARNAKRGIGPIIRS